ncbi:unnamed protein product [Staurois parvus]|uniref:Uncharacterized protein n=1 Tax=Staurois parvus TaxID=386267 RepID=A0ABN9CU85_9NEOB|nr:unnamed protein product [Staurois parvus]
MLFDCDFSGPPLLPVPPSYLLIEQRLRGKLHMLSLVYIAGVFFSLESACDQHRANLHSPDRDQGSCILQRKMKTPPTSWNQCSAGH